MSLRFLFKQHRKSLTEVHNDHEEECNDLQDRIDELELELEVERSRRCDAVSYAQSVKDRRIEDRTGSSDASSDLQDGTSSQKERLSKLEDTTEKLERKIAEKYETENALRQELDAKDKMIEDLKHTVADQDELITQLGNHLMALLASSNAQNEGNSGPEKEGPQERRTSLDELMTRLRSLSTTSRMPEETPSSTKSVKEAGTDALKEGKDPMINPPCMLSSTRQNLSRS